MDFCWQVTAMQALSGVLRHDLGKARNGGDGARSRVEIAAAMEASRMACAMGMPAA